MGSQKQAIDKASCNETSNYRADSSKLRKSVTFVFLLLLARFKDIYWCDDKKSYCTLDQTYSV